MAKAQSYELYESWKQEYLGFLALDRIIKLPNGCSFNPWTLWMDLNTIV